MAVAYTPLLIFALLVQSSVAIEDASASTANPIRKVVQMLQAMQEKVTAEGEKEKKLYEEFECYCKTNGGGLQESIAAAQLKVPSVGSDIEEATAKKAQLEQDLKQHKADRTEAKKAIADADAIREKEAAAFAKEKSEADSNIGALTGAIAALERGMTGGFLQTTTAQVLKKLTISSKRLLDPDRREVLAFLTNTDNQGYVPQSGEIVGILKELKDEMGKDLADATAAEDSAIESHSALVAAKNQEIGALTAAIEDKSTRLGEVSVSIVEMKNDLSDTEAALLADQKFLADLDATCETKKQEWDERSKTRSEELVAIAETIKILNDDDALELFKKTLPSPSFVQMKVRTESMRAQALVVLHELQRSLRPSQAAVDFISLALSGKKVGFDKVMKMIDGLVETLKQEQKDDDAKKSTCNTQLDLADDKKKGLEGKKSTLEASIADTEETLSTLKSDIKALEESIAKLDKQVAAATEQRKEEHESYQELMASDKAAKDLLLLAKNRLYKFYTPQLHKAPEEESLMQKPLVFAEVSEHVQRVDDAPAPPPETWGAYKTKGGESNGVLAMIDLLVKDLEKEMTEAETEEKNGQAEYEKAMEDAAATRTADSKHLTDKKVALADSETALQSHSEDKTSTEKELSATEAYISSLHADCDWLLKYFEVRKEARAGEIDALGRAKAVLSGASFS